SIMSIMLEDGEQIGRFKVRGHMQELGLISKQPGSHTYKKQQCSGQTFRIF
ncbi:ISPsy13, transposase OrfB, partial [Pseudomonas syringae pv. pisi str. 1704B]